MKKRKIVISKLVSNEESIRFYSKKGDIFIAAYIDDYLFVSKQKEDFQKETHNKNADLNTKFCLSYLLNFSIGGIFLTCSSFFFFLFVFSLLGYHSLCILSPFLSLCVSFCFSFLHFFYNYDAKLKDYHSAEHKMYNFIRNNGRLPFSLQELRKSSRFQVDCSSLNSFLDYLSYYCAYLRAYSIFIIGFYLSLFLKSSFSILAKLFIFLSILIIVILKKRFLKIFITCYLFLYQYANFFCQLFTTTKKVSDDALILVYYLTKIYIKEEYPEYLEEEWMKYNPEFDTLKTQVKFINLT